MRRIALAMVLIYGFSTLAVDAAAETVATANNSVHANKQVGFYITSKQIPPNLLPKPPLPRSRAWQHRIQQIIGIHTYAAPDEVIAAREEQHLRPEIMTRLLGEKFTRDNLPATFALIDRVTADTESVTQAAKKHWHTIRPYQLDKHVKLQVDPLPKDNYGYPSGHTGTGYVWAQLLSFLRPDATVRLNYQAERIAMHRVVAGVHTLHDVAGGRKLGQEIIKALKKSPSFQHDLALASKEVCDRAHAPDQMAAVKRKNWKSFKSRAAQ